MATNKTSEAAEKEGGPARAPRAGGRSFRGTVVSAKMKDTAAVLVERYVKHPKYKKYLRRTKKYLAHDEGNVHREGEIVTIIETKPISKRKHFKIQN